MLDIGKWVIPILLIIPVFIGLIKGIWKQKRCIIDDKYLACEKCGLMHFKNDVKKCSNCGGKLIPSGVNRRNGAPPRARPLITTTPVSPAWTFLPIFLGIICGIMEFGVQF